MAKRTRASEIPLVKRPIAEIVRIANEAGCRAAGNAELIQSAFFDMRFEWIGKAFPEGFGLSDDQFDDIVSRACDAFDEGIDDYRDSLNKPRQLSSPPLTGVGYWFSEDDSFAFGLMVDTSKFHVEQFHSEALFNRFHARLLSEYDRLALQIEAARAEGTDVSAGNPEGGPLSITFSSDESLFLQIVPSAIDRETLVTQLPGALKNFVEMLGQAVEVTHG